MNMYIYIYICIYKKLCGSPRQSGVRGDGRVDHLPRGLRRYLLPLTSVSDESVRSACNHQLKQNGVASKRGSGNANREAPTCPEASDATLDHYLAPGW